MQKSSCVIAATAAVFIVILGSAAERVLNAQATAAPRFQVDPSWPMELPNNWIFGSITGVYVDSRQHVWVTHLPETLTEEELGLVQKPPFGEGCQAAARPHASSTDAGSTAREQAPTARGLP